MKSLALIAAAAITCSLAAPEALAQHRHRHGGHHHRHHGHGHGPHVYWSAPLVWSLPLYAYPVYERPPIVVEPLYEPPPPRYYAPPPRVERPVPYRERPYAEAPPSRPAPKVAIAKPMRERYTLSATELFEFDKAELRQPQPKLDEIAEAMKANPEVREVTITGYTDRLGSDEYNLELSMRRAAAVKSYLVGKGVDRDRLKAVGKGEANSVAHCDDTLKREELIKCLEPNRRVEVERITVERRAP